jgi:hypothetical protein
MSDSCGSACSTGSAPRTHVCPVNGLYYKAVGVRTILHHIRAPWGWSGKSQAYYFCEDPDCDVIYFGEDSSVIKRSELRTVVGIKDPDPGALACYCFGVSRADVKRFPGIRGFIAEKTRAGMCSCETANPAGRCCLKDLSAGQ